MKLIRFVPELHYETINNWWHIHGGVSLPLDHLPTGYLVESRGRPICAAFLYLNGTAMAHVEWIVVNPDAGLKERYNGLDVLISGIKLIAASLGVKSLFCSLKHDGLIVKMMDGHGFVRAESGMTNLLWKV